MITYETHVNPFAHEFARVKIPDDMIKKACVWVDAMVVAKASETHWQKDHGHATKRILTGIMGEIATEIVLDQKFIDWSIGPNSAEYHNPDLAGIGSNIGVKTVEHGKFPLIFKVNYYPQIINIFRYKDKTCFVCGLATPEVLDEYQSDDLILSPALKRRGTKSGFYGFEHLRRLK
jgi:hypothetical protein